MNDYFATLGLPRDAGEADIRAAYRLLARKYHPDMGGTHPIEAFHAVLEAWEVLSEESSREAHRRGLGGRPPSRRRRRRQRAIDPMERGATDRATFEVRVDVNVVEFGGTVRVAVPVDTACPDCRDERIQRKSCTVCESTGRLRLRVRATLSLPPGVEVGCRVKVYGHMELFGPFETHAVVRIA